MRKSLAKLLQTLTKLPPNSYTEGSFRRRDRYAQGRVRLRVYIMNACLESWASASNHRRQPRIIGVGPESWVSAPNHGCRSRIVGYNSEQDELRTVARPASFGALAGRVTVHNPMRFGSVFMRVKVM